MTFDPNAPPSFNPGGFGTRAATYEGQRIRPANPSLDIYGGSTPWQQSLGQYQAAGRPNVGDRPFEGLGKTNAALNLPFAPATSAGISRNQAPTPVGAPQPGMFEALGGGLGQLAMDTVIPLDMITKPFGSDLGYDVEKNAVGLLQNVGSVFDGILDFIPNALGWDNIGLLPGGGDIAGTYEALPEDELKATYDRLISENPTARMEYMKQYLDRRGPDIARMNGFSGAFAELATPSASISEQLRRIIFGGMMLPGQAVNRTFVGSRFRDVDDSILRKDDSELPEELRSIKQRHLDGEISKEEMLDEISLSEYRWTNSDGPESFFLNLALDLGTDPLIWASFGVGSAASTVAKTAAYSARLSTTGALRNAVKAGSTSARSLVDDVARRANWKGSSDDLLKSSNPEHHKLFHEAIQKSAPDLYKEGMSKLNRRQRVAYELDPVIQPVAAVTREIDSMFGMFGAGKVAGRMSAFRSAKHAEGMTRAAGVRVVKELQDFFGDEFDSFTRYFGVSAGNLSMALGARSMSERLLASTRAVDQTGVKQTPPMAPTAYAKAHRDKSAAKGLDYEAEAAYLQYQETFLPKGEFGDVAQDKAATAARDAMAPDLAAATGKTSDEAKKFLAKADRRQLAFTHWVLYGKQVVDFNAGKADYLQALKQHLNQARQAGDDDAIKRLEGLIEDGERYTLVSENTLTFQDAKTLVASLKSGANDVNQQALDAINQYDQLDMNFGQRGGSSDKLRRELIHHLETLIERDALIKIVEPGKVNARISGKLSDRYRVGLAPEDVWGIVKDENGQIVGVNAFVDALSDEMPSLSRRLTTMDRIKQALASPIRGSRIHAENKVRFRVEANKNFKMRKGEADRLFNAINREAINRQKGARAFGAHELNEIAKDAGVHISEDLKAKYGERAILHLVLSAYEGDIAMMGLSSAASARVKSKFGRIPLGDNLLGKIAEDYYPKLRFSASPIFLAMEWVEGPFFAILRGIKPGWKYSEQDLRSMRILETLRPDYAETGAGIGRAQLAYGDGQVAIRVVEASRIQKQLNKVLPQRLQFPAKRLKGPSAANVYDLKRLLYQRQAARDAAETFVRAMKDEYPPDVYKAWANAAGSADPLRIWTTFMEEKGWFAPDAGRHALHMFDAQRSGTKDRIRLGDVAHFLQFPDTDALRRAIHEDKTMTRDKFFKAYKDVNANEEFVQRAWRNANGFTVEEWDVALKDALGEKEAAASMGMFRWLAQQQKRNLDEFLNDHFGTVANVVDRSIDVPAAAFRQTVKDSIEKAGMVYYDVASPEFQRAQRYMRDLLPQQASIARVIENERRTPGTVEMVKARDLPDIPAGNDIDKKKVAALAKSMKMDGWVGDEFIDVTYYQRSGTIDVGEGNHRLLAAKKAGIEVPITVTRLDAEGPGMKVRDLANEDGYVPAQLPLSQVIDLGGPTGSLRRKITNAQANIADPDNTNHLPPSNEFTERSYQQMWEDIQNVLPDQDFLNSAANWYDEMMTTFLGLTSKMDEATITSLLKVWDENAPESMRAALPDVTDIAEGRVVLAARLNVAFSGSQMNTSVLDGMRKVTAILDETLNGMTLDDLRPAAMKKIENTPEKWKAYQKLLNAGDLQGVEMMVRKNIDTRFGFEAVRGRLESVIRDFGELPPEAIAQKLSDFNDNLAGYTRRSSSPLDGLQPAAMDIWMKRAWGFPDSAYFDDLVRHHMDVNEGVSRAAAEKAVLKERNWKRDWVKELTEEEKKQLKKQGIEEGAPTPQQYEWMLKRTNEFKDYLNEQGIKGPNGEWRAHEIQALMWVAEQKRLSYPDNPTFSLFNQTGRQLAIEVDPAKMNEVWNKRYPRRADMLDELGPDIDAAMSSINYEIVTSVMKMITENTKSTVIRMLDGSEELGTTVVFGSERMSLETAHHLAAALDREVVVMGRPADVTLKATKTKPEVSSNIKEGGRHWSFDFTFDPALDVAEVQPHLAALREFLEQYLSPDEFPHALTAQLDDNAVALRFAWDSTNNADIATRLGEIADERAALMDTTGSKAKRLRTDEEKALLASLKAKKKKDGKLSAKEQKVIDRLTLETGGKDISVRTAEEQALIDSIGKEMDRAAAGQATLRNLKQNNPLPDNVYAALEDGSWVKAFDPDAEPVPINLRHEQVNYQVVTPEQGVKYVGNPETVRKYRQQAQFAADGAYADVAPNSLGSHRARTGLADGEVFNQRELTGTGRVRAGFEYRNDQRRSRLHFVRNLADASSGLHESFHLFARLLDPSAERQLVNAYNAAHGLAGPRGKYAKRKLTRQVEEWVAAEFEKFAAGQGTTKTAEFYPIFKAFGEWAKNDPGMKAAGTGKIDPTFAKVMNEMQDVPSGFQNLDEYRLMETARISLLKAEEQAHSTAYYRRGPNWMMRSMNHPYLGLYPASYMWGKVLPELTRFLLKKPFGLNAPLGGLQMYNHVHRGIAEQFYTDESLNQFVEDHPDTVRFLTMMLPGNPVEMPVNLPVVARRAMEHDAENRMRQLAGQEPEDFDLAGAVGDMASYAVGFAQLPDRAGKMIGEWVGEDGPNAGKTTVVNPKNPKFQPPPPLT